MLLFRVALRDPDGNPLLKIDPFPQAFCRATDWRAAQLNDSRTRQSARNGARLASDRSSTRRPASNQSSTNIHPRHPIREKKRARIERLSKTDRSLRLVDPLLTRPRRSLIHLAGRRSLMAVGCLFFPRPASSPERSRLNGRFCVYVHVNGLVLAGSQRDSTPRRGRGPVFVACTRTCAPRRPKKTKGRASVLEPDRPLSTLRNQRVPSRRWISTRLLRRRELPDPLREEKFAAPGSRREKPPIRNGGNGNERCPDRELSRRYSIIP